MIVIKTWKNLLCIVTVSCMYFIAVCKFCVVAITSPQSIPEQSIIFMYSGICKIKTVSYLEAHGLSIYWLFQINCAFPSPKNSSVILDKMSSRQNLSYVEGTFKIGSYCNFLVRIDTKFEINFVFRLLKNCFAFQVHHFEQRSQW